MIKTMLSKMSKKWPRGWCGRVDGDHQPGSRCAGLCEEKRGRWGGATSKTTTVKGNRLVHANRRASLEAAPAPNRRFTERPFHSSVCVC
jgi:hypothetical protein